MTTFFASGFVLVSDGQRIELYAKSRGAVRRFGIDSLSRAFAGAGLPLGVAVPSVVNAAETEEDGAPLWFVLARSGEVTEVWRSVKMSWRELRWSLRAKGAS